MYSIPDDDELVRNMILDDHDAFTVLVNRYNTQLYSIIRGRVLSDDDAKDILQEVFISFWNKRKTLVLRGPVIAYLCGAVRYAVIDFQVKNNRYLSKIELLLPESETPAIDSQIIAGELKDEILKLANKLPPTVRTVFRLSRIEHKSNREIAEELNISDKTVRNSLSIALHFLRKHTDSTVITILALDRILHLF